MADTKDDPEGGSQSFLTQNAKPMSEGSCSVCDPIGDFTIRSKDYQRISLGSWKGFIDRVWCSTCQQVVRFVQDSKDPAADAMTMSCPMIIRDYGDSFYLQCELNDSYIIGHRHGRPFKLIKPQVLLPDGAHYISLNPQKIEIDQLRWWLAECDEHHLDTCNTRLDLGKTESAPSMTFIDLTQSCLVSPKATVRYAALSYVWGNIPGTLMATVSNLNDLCTPGPFESLKTKTRLPRTILDAMYFTKLMGLDYLWVDRLCIVQDSRHHFNEQLKQMASIYNNAHFTIIAASGEDANHGLRGIGGSSPNRTYEQTYSQFSPNAPRLLFEYLCESSWNQPAWYSRAWKFQERAVSRKIFVFVNDTVYWQCRSHLWPEYLQKPRLFEGGHLTRSWPSHSLTQPVWPDLDAYGQLVQGFNSRALTYESDAIKAFSAIIDVFSRSFHGGFLSGIPELFFDMSLLWSANKRLNRRKSFLSWSWVGWSGNIKFLSGSMWDPSCWGDQSVRIWSVAKWEKRQGESCTVDNSYHVYQDMAHNYLEAELPWGWSCEPGLTSFFDGRFNHQAIEGSYYFPFPIVDGLAKPAMEDWSSLLTCQTNRCMLSLGCPCETSQYNASRECLVVELRDKYGSPVGVIESGFTDEKEFIQGEPCEVIAISEGSAKREYRDGVWQPYDEMNTIPELQNEHCYYFCNVLWIEREGDISYRKAVSRVMKAAWERQSLESNYPRVVIGTRPQDFSAISMIAMNDYAGRSENSVQMKSRFNLQNK